MILINISGQKLNIKAIISLEDSSYYIQKQISYDKTNKKELYKKIKKVIMLLSITEI